jgi:hypothetical protein
VLRGCLPTVKHITVEELIKELEKYPSDTLVDFTYDSIYGGLCKVALEDHYDPHLPGDS